MSAINSSFSCSISGPVLCFFLGESSTVVMMLMGFAAEVVGPEHLIAPGGIGLSTAFWVPGLCWLPDDAAIASTRFLACGCCHLASATSQKELLLGFQA
jgi:hypothetical protein